MRATDIVVICSRCEAFGRTGVEAMLLGKPVIYPNTGGILEYMVEGETGLSYTPGDIDKLVEQLERLIAAPSMWPIIGNFGRKHASMLFSKERFSGKANQSLLKLRARGKANVQIPATIERYLSSGADLLLMFSGNIRRNDACPCGSGKRFKHCHGQF